MTAAGDVLELTAAPTGRREWTRSLWAHRHVLVVLAKKDFQTRYKRATFGLMWAVAVPMLQALIMAVVFSRVIKTGSGLRFSAYVMGGVIAYSYFGSVLSSASTSIVDGAALTDKVWFPRVLLVLVPVLSNLVGLVITLGVVVLLLPAFNVPIGAHLLWFIPATILLIAFTTSLSLVLAALDVYYRDVKFLVQAALMVWLYVTPILYPANLLGRLEFLTTVNPLTGVVDLFHLATVGQRAWVVPVAISVGCTVALAVVGAEAQRRHDRLFVDLL